MLLYVALGSIVLFILSAYWIQKKSRKISTDLAVEIWKIERNYTVLVDQYMKNQALESCERQIKLNLLTSHVMTKLKVDIEKLEKLVKNIKPVVIEVAYEPDFFPSLKIFCEEYFMHQEGNTNNKEASINLIESVKYAVQSDLEKRLLVIEQEKIL